MEKHRPRNFEFKSENRWTKAVSTQRLGLFVEQIHAVPGERTGFFIQLPKMPATAILATLIRWRSDWMKQPPNKITVKSHPVGANVPCLQGVGIVCNVHHQVLASNFLSLKSRQTWMKKPIPTRWVKQLQYSIFFNKKSDAKERKDIETFSQVMMLSQSFSQVRRHKRCATNASAARRGYFMSRFQK